MRNSNGDIEILLLLCCIVGVVAFFCFSLGVTNLMQQATATPELQEKLDTLMNEKEQKQALVNELKVDKKNLKEEIENLGIKSFEDKLSKTQRRKLEEDLKELQEKRDHLTSKIKKRRKDLARLDKKTDPEKRKEKEKELRELQKELQSLNMKIEKIIRLLQHSSGSKKLTHLKDNKKKLTDKLNKLREEKTALKNKVNILRTKKIWIGSSKFKNPLFVECRKDAYIIYPRREAIALGELENRNILEEMVTGHDIIILLVRPSGYESFRKAYAKVKTMSVAKSYEPVIAEKDLGFLEKKNEK